MTAFAPNLSVLTGGLFGSVIGGLFAWLGFSSRAQYYAASNKEIPKSVRRLLFAPLGLLILFYGLRDIWLGIR